MRRAFLITVGLLLLAASASSAQTPIIIGANSAFEWDVPGVDAALAVTLTYAVTVDGGTPKPFTGVTCVAGPVQPSAVCRVPIAQIPTGAHAVTMTAASGAIISVPSASFAYVDVLIPIPSGLRAKP